MKVLKSRVGLIIVTITIAFLLFVFVRNSNTIVFVSEKVIDYASKPSDKGKSFVYEDEVDFRIIVITYNRAKSLVKLLRTIDDLELDGDKAALEIWVDIDKEGRAHKETVQTAKSFKWKLGPTTVHVQTAHAGIYGQWIDTWRPRSVETKELALILEDDISVSKYCYRWIKEVFKLYSSRTDFAGTSLTSDEQKSHDGSFNVLSVSKNETVFMYKCIGTWGFSPKPSVWMRFQDWYHAHINKPDFHPYVPGMVGTEWYKGFERSGKADTMWEQWFIYYAYKEKLFTMYNNLKAYNGDTKSCLCINRREVGLHVGTKGREDYCTVLDRWNESFVSPPERLTKLDWDGKVIDKY